MLQDKYRDGVPCDHKGCLSHITQRCEGCGRLGGISGNVEQANKNRLKEINKIVQAAELFNKNKNLSESFGWSDQYAKDIPYLLTALQEEQAEITELYKILDQNHNTIELLDTCNQKDVSDLNKTLQESQLKIHQLQNSIACVRDANRAWKNLVNELREELIKIKNVWQ